MGNTDEVIEPTNAMQESTKITDVNENSSEQKKSFSLSQMVTAVINNELEITKEKISLDNLLAELNSPNGNKTKVQRTKGIKNQAGAQALDCFDTNSNVRYYEIPNCSSDAPKVRLHDVVLNIKPKTGVEEVPPRRDE